MPIITILDTGALVAGLDLFTRGWIALLRGIIFSCIISVTRAYE